MPSNKDFVMSILVGGVELPEYEKDGEVYVESNLFTPVSYTQESEELVQGEVEKQNWPVTPYQVKITAMPNTPYSYYKVYVDGQKATQIAVQPGRSSISEGFYDGANITEFLFSLPRFPQNKKDRMEKGKATRVGTIEVECWNSRVTGYKKPLINHLEYSQANKKDSTNVTNGEYMMATTKIGRSLRTTQKSMVEDWTLFNIRSKLTIRYVMGHSLVDMGFKLRPIRIPVHRVPASVVSQPQKRKKHTARKSMSPRISLGIGLGAVIEEVLEIEDEEEELIIGDFVPAKKQKQEDLADLDVTFGIPVPGTSKDDDNVEIVDESTEDKAKVDETEKNGEDKTDKESGSKKEKKDEVNTSDDDKKDDSVSEKEKEESEEIKTEVGETNEESKEDENNADTSVRIVEEECENGKEAGEAEGVEETSGVAEAGVSPEPTETAEMGKSGTEEEGTVEEAQTETGEDTRTVEETGAAEDAGTAEEIGTDKGTIEDQVDAIEAIISATENQDTESNDKADENVETDAISERDAGENSCGNNVGESDIPDKPKEDSDNVDTNQDESSIVDNEKESDVNDASKNDVDDEIDLPVIVNPGGTLGDELVLE